MRQVTVLLMIVAAGCSAGKSRRQDDPRIRRGRPDFKVVDWKGRAGTELEVRHSLVPEGKFLEGEIATLKLTIRNRSDQFILLEKIEDPFTQEALSWQIAEAGTLRYDAGNDRFVLDEKGIDRETGRRGRSPAVFNNGMLVPAIVEEGQTHFDEQEISIRTRLLGLPRTFTLRYWVLPEVLVRDRVYFPVGSSPNDPNKGQESIREFKRPVESYLSRYVRERQLGDFSLILRRDRFVFDPETAFRTGTWSLSVRVNAKVPARRFSYDHALAVSGWEKADRHTYSTRLSAWFLQSRGRGTLMVRPTGMIPIPDTDLRILFSLDAGDLERQMRPGHVEIQFLWESQNYFYRWYAPPRNPKEQGKVGSIATATLGDGTYRQSLVLPVEQLREFLERAGTVQQVKIVRGPTGGFQVTLR